MARAALKDAPPSARTVEEFLAWDDGTDTRYELVGGKVVAMTAPSPAHGLIVGNLAREIGNRLRLPCRVFLEVGVRLPARDDAFYQADIVIGCTSLTADSRTVPEPVAILEVLSPTTAAHDRGTKVPDYRPIPSVREIVVVSSMAVGMEVWRRTGEEWMVADMKAAGAVLGLDSVGIELPLAAVYDGVVFEPDVAAAETGEA